MSRRVLVDTGPLVALLSARDQHHERCIAAAKGLPLPLYTSLPIITEASHLLNRSGCRPRDIIALVKNSRLTLLPLTRGDLICIDKILEKYDDQNISFADASLMYLADQEAINEVFTVDQKDFSVFRTSSGKPLTLIG